MCVQKKKQRVNMRMMHLMNRIKLGKEGDTTNGDEKKRRETKDGNRRKKKQKKKKRGRKKELKDNTQIFKERMYRLLFFNETSNWYNRNNDSVTVVLFCTDHIFHFMFIISLISTNKRIIFVMIFFSFRNQILLKSWFIVLTNICSINK